jgi:hypothetical protein
MPLALVTALAQRFHIAAGHGIYCSTSTVTQTSKRIPFQVLTSIRRRTKYLCDGVTSYTLPSGRLSVATEQEGRSSATTVHVIYWDVRDQGCLGVNATNCIANCIANFGNRTKRAKFRVNTLRCRGLRKVL